MISILPASMANPSRSTAMRMIFEDPHSPLQGLKTLSTLSRSFFSSSLIGSTNKSLRSAILRQLNPTTNKMELKEDIHRLCTQDGSLLSYASSITAVKHLGFKTSLDLSNTEQLQHSNYDWTDMQPASMNCTKCRFAVPS